MKNNFKICPECKSKFYSLFDKTYIELYGNCFDCDEYKGQVNFLKEEEINERRKKAIEKSGEKYENIKHSRLASEY